MSFLGVGAPEAILVGIVALLVFGPKGLADVSAHGGLQAALNCVAMPFSGGNPRQCPCKCMADVGTWRMACKTPMHNSALRQPGTRR
jgi:hypothetical protein